MHEQYHAFCDENEQRFALVTMADVAANGTPVDPEDGEDFEYFGPVLWANPACSVAINPDNYRLAILGADDETTLIDCKAAIERGALATEDTILGVVLDGGLVQSIVSNRPQSLQNLDVLIVDYDVEDMDEEQLHEVIDPHDGKPHKAAVRLAAIEPAKIDLSGLRQAIESDWQ
jgi:hypothetical protein